MLRGFERHDEELTKLRSDMKEGFERHDKLFERHSEELTRLREDMLRGFERHDEELTKLREDMKQGFERRDEELARLREDMKEGFRRHDEELTKLREDMIAGFERYDKILERHGEEILKLREDMKEGFEYLNRHISALGARWGLMAEEAFREGLRGLLEKELNLKVESWVRNDEEGVVFGYPSVVEIDLSISDDKVTLVEISSHVRPSDVLLFLRKARFFERLEGRKPDRLLMVTPYAEKEAFRTAKKYGIEIYTKV
ncbi:hypothetical protein CP083_06835 [Candidatus Bathyarchaeota archaeon B24-2]|nr:MAG: hypothetical protein CP083_06835 [Candidatus Bathyarchaeota archaeon B24-2]